MKINKLFLSTIFIFTISYISIFSESNEVFAQDNEKIIVKGRVYNSATKKPVDFATVVLYEAKIKSRTDKEGYYEISINEPGEYTIMVMSSGLKMLKFKIKINKSIKRDLWLKPITIKGGALTIRADRKIQSVSRRTMSVEELKETPASFNDAISALTSLPGVNRTSGFFGPLIIRGMYSSANRYFIDGMPLYYPQHLFGLHSVIANDLMSEIDLYASAFPAEFGDALGSIININTIDSVKEFGGNIDIGMISATALLKIPFKKKVIKDDKIEKENAGYCIVAGRYGYLSLIIPLFYKWIVGEELSSVPEYWDYQLKAKYYITSKHSLSVLLLGSSDYLNFLESETSFGNTEGSDPLIEDSRFKMDQMFHNQALYYTYQNSKFKNKLMVYSSWSQSYTYADTNENAASWAQDYKMDTRPYILGIKNYVNWEVLKNKIELRGSVEYAFYHFTAKGKTFVIGDNNPGFDLGDDDSVLMFPIDEKIDNHTIEGYLDARFTSNGFTCVPGARVQYLERTNSVTVDPRIMFSYESEVGFSIATAWGMYSSFFQTNPFLFTNAPGYTSIDYAGPERAYHNSLRLEQKIQLYTISVEGFYNYFYDQIWSYYHYKNGEERYVVNSGKLQAYGVEIMVRKDIQKGVNDFFGWISYTFTQSKEKTGLTGNIILPGNIDSGEKYDINGHRWLTSGLEMEHALKIVFGYKIKQHTISMRFQLYTSYPYTKIVGDYEDPSNAGRYVPVYSNDVNAHNFDVDHRLDIRYSYQSNYRWGHVKWYIEFINFYGMWYKPKNNYRWRYDKPYADGSNPSYEEPVGLSLVPNFGVEVKF